MLPPKKSVAKIQLKSGGCRKSIGVSQDIHSQKSGLPEPDVWKESAVTMGADALSFLASHFLPFAATCQRFTEISFRGRALFLHPLSGVVLCLFLSICPKKERKVKLVLWDYREEKKFSGVSSASWLETQQALSLWLATKDTASLPAKSPLTSVWVRLGQEKPQPSLIEEKLTLAETISCAPDLQWEP